MKKLGLDFINKLEPITYRVKDNPSILHHGLSAQSTKRHVQGNDDALATTHEDGVMGIDYMSMVGVLTKDSAGIKQQGADITEANKQMKLEDRVNKLEQRACAKPPAAAIRYDNESLEVVNQRFKEIHGYDMPRHVNIINFVDA